MQDELNINGKRCIAVSMFCQARATMLIGFIYCVVYCDEVITRYVIDKYTYAHTLIAIKSREVQTYCIIQDTRMQASILQS